jgi:hypothetical protein
MKKVIIPIFLMVILISCNKELGDIKFSEAIPGGCALDKGTSQKATVLSEADRAIYSIVDGNLEIYVGFNGSCCGQYDTSSEIKNDTIFIKILTTQIGLCNCVCNYTYTFKFIGDGNNYSYNVTVDNVLILHGKINP